MTKNFWYAIGGIVIAFTFRSIGLFGSLGTVIAIVAILAGLALIQKIPVSKFNMLSKIFLAYVIIILALPSVWNLIGNRMPFTKKALENRSVMEDARLGEYMKPDIPKHLLALKGLADGLEDLEGERLMWDAKVALKQYSRGDISYNKLMSKYSNLESKARRDLEFGKRASNFMKNQGGPGLTGRLENLWNAPSRVVMWGLVSILIVATIVSAATGKVVIKKYAIGLVVLIGLAFLADSFIYGSLRNKISGKLSAPNTSASTLASSQTIHQIDINPYTNSRPLQVPPGAFLDVSTPGWHEFRFDSGEVLRVENGMVTRTKNGVVSKLNKFPSRLPSTKFYMRGENGTAIVKIN